MKISLILATLGRTPLLRRFLASLQEQTHRDFELIVVDQGPARALAEVLAPFRETLPVLHLRQDPPGLSRARNAGLHHLRGEVVAFPDDDCWYPPDLLEKVSALLVAHPRWDGVVGRLIWDETGPPRVERSRIVKLSRFNAMTSLDARSPWAALVRYPPVAVSSVTLFLRSEACERVGGFDEQLGLGAGTPFGGGEDLDLIVRCLQAGLEIYHHPELKVYHPHPQKGYADPQRGFAYGAGLGRVLRKHRYPRWFAFYHFLRTFGALIHALLRGQRRPARYHAAVLKGKIAGWHHADPDT